MSISVISEKKLTPIMKKYKFTLYMVKDIV